MTVRTIDHDGTTVTPSYCRICPALCGILVEVDDATGTVLHVRGDRDHPLSKGFTCPKGRALPDELAAPDRIRSSLKRGSTGLEPIGTHTAITEIADRLTAIVEEHGPRAVGLYVGTRGYEILQLTAATAWLRALGSPSLYSTYTIDQPAKDLARAMHGSWSAGFQDASSSDVIMFVGNNPLVSATSSYVGFPPSNARVELRERKEAGLSVIVIDPRRTETAEWADVHLQVRPGQDAAVLAGMIRHIIDNGLVDTSFVAAWAEGLDRLREAVEPFDPATVQRRADIAPVDLIRAADLFGRGPRGCAIGGTGLNMAPHPVLNEYLLLCLNTLGGRYLRTGDRVHNPGVLTGGRRNVAEARGPRAIWGRGPQPRLRGLSTLYDQMPSSALADEITTPGDGQIRALIVSGGNPVAALPDQQRVAEAFGSLELLVCLDVRSTETTAFADYVISSRLSLEKADTTVAHDLRFSTAFAQATPAIVSGPPDAIEEWEFFYDLCAAMNLPWDLRGRVGMPVPLDLAGNDSVAERPTSDSLWDMLCSGGRVALDEVRRHPHGLTPTLEPVFVEAPATPIDDRLQLADADLLDELATTLDDEFDESFPFLLTSRRMWEYYNSWGQDIASIRRKWVANPAFMHPADMAELTIGDGALIRISSTRAGVVAVAVASDDVRRGMVSMAHCWGAADRPDDAPRDTGASSSRLVDSRTDLSQYVGMPRQSAIRVRVVGIDDDRSDGDRSPADRIREWPGD